MTIDQPDLRLSDGERQEALDALSEHVRTGRLDVDEYGERSERVTTARTRRELAPLFEDLPEPRPSVLERPKPAPVQPARRGSPAARGLAFGVLPVLVIVALGLIVLSRGEFALPIAPLVVLFLVFGRRHRW